MSISTDTPSDKHIPPKRIKASLLIRLGVSVMLLGIGWLLIDWLIVGQGNMTPPASLAGLTSSEQIVGPEALVAIEQLHGKTFPMTDGAVATYEGGAAVLWISSTWIPLMAARQVDVMTERIAEGRSPFTPLGTQKVDGATVYALTGMGQMHYYFQLDRRVVWLAVSPQFAERSLNELVRYLQFTNIYPNHLTR